MFKFIRDLREGANRARAAAVEVNREMERLAVLPLTEAEALAKAVLKHATISLSERGAPLDAVWASVDASLGRLFRDRPRIEFKSGTVMDVG